MRPATLLLLALILVPGFAVTGVADTYPPITTLTLCGPGTTWASLPTHSDMMTAEDICAAVGAAAVSVSQRFPDNAATYVYDCVLGTCSAPVGPIPEPGCSGSACFCVNAGEGFDVKTSAPALLPINGCDEYIPIGLPFAVGPLLSGTLVSVPQPTFLATMNDLGIHFGLPSAGIVRGTVSRYDCVTGSFSVCSLGTTSCAAMTLIPGEAYVLRNTTSGVLTATNPVACAPQAGTPCAIDTLAVSYGGGSNTLTWSAPAACGLPLVYEVARGDLSCLAHPCSHCASCTILATTALTSYVDVGSPPTVWYLVRVVGGTWNVTGGCTNRDIMFGLGCP